MSSVGPQLPTHLTKRKRSIDDNAEDAKSPPHKVQAASAPQEIEPRIVGSALPPQAATNPDALDIDSSSDDDYGPSAPSNKPITTPPKRVVGPALPPPKNPDELDVNDNSSSDDGYGPATSKAKPSPPPANKPSAPPSKKRVLGPAPPPAPLSELPPHPANAEPSSSSSDSEDDYGPSLPPAPGSSAAAKAQFEQEQAQQREALLRDDSAPAKPRRDEWMLLPPSDSDRSSRVDPTRLKNRKFASGKSVKSSGAGGAGGSGGISSIWTETPEEKRKRLADEVLGRTEVSTSTSATSLSTRADSKKDEETARRIRQYNERNRGRSLAEQKKGGGDGKEEEEDDPSKRGFDKEKDMALGGRVGHVQKREMLAKAADFGTRFQKGRYL